MTNAPPSPRFDRLKRASVPMPADIRAALDKRGLTAAYEQRPAYQQNDYLAWITRAKLPATRAKRLAQMLSELESGDTYMNMAHRNKAS